MKTINDRILDAVAGVWKTSSQLYSEFKADFESQRKLTDSLKRMHKDGLIQGHHSYQWFFASLDAPDYEDADRLFLEQLAEVVIQVLPDDEWLKAADIFKQLPADFQERCLSSVIFSRLLGKLCEMERLRKARTDRGVVFALVGTPAMDEKRLTQDVIKYLEGRAVLMSEFRDRFMNTPFDVELSLNGLKEKGLVRVCNCKSAICGAGYIEDGFFALNDAFVQMARGKTLRNVYEFAR